VFESPRGHHNFNDLDAWSSLPWEVVLHGCCILFRSTRLDVGGQRFDVVVVSARDKVPVQVHGDLDGGVPKLPVQDDWFSPER
jgi:hypothetical protein